MLTTAFGTVARVKKRAISEFCPLSRERRHTRLYTHYTAQLNVANKGIKIKQGRKIRGEWGYGNNYKYSDQGRSR